MTTAKEFARAGITGQTFREIQEKFGKSWNELGQSGDIMTNYALAFAWFRDREHLPVPAAYDKAMQLTTDGVNALFDDGDDVDVQKHADFVSPPSTTTQ